MEDEVEKVEIENDEYVMPFDTISEFAYSEVNETSKSAVENAESTLATRTETEILHSNQTVSVEEEGIASATLSQSNTRAAAQAQVDTANSLTALPQQQQVPTESAIKEVTASTTPNQTAPSFDGGKDTASDTGQQAGQSVFYSQLFSEEAIAPIESQQVSRPSPQPIASQFANTPLQEAIKNTVLSKPTTSVVKADAPVSGFAQAKAKNVTHRFAENTKQTNLPESTQEKIINKVKELLESAKALKHGSTMVVRLDPPKLGNVTLKITQRSNALHARIIPETPEVEQVLRSNSSELLQLLGISGIKAENIHLSIGQVATSSEQLLFNQFFDSSSQFNQHQSSSGEQQLQEYELPGSVVPQEQHSEDIGGWVA